MNKREIVLMHVRLMSERDVRDIQEAVAQLCKILEALEKGDTMYLGRDDEQYHVSIDGQKDDMFLYDVVVTILDKLNVLHDSKIEYPEPATIEAMYQALETEYQERRDYDKEWYESLKADIQALDSEDSD